MLRTQSAMRTHSQAPKRENGVMLLEALIAILIFSIGILAVVGLQAVSIRNVTDSKHRTEAAFLANNLLSQMWTDAGNIASYAYPGSGGAPTRLTGWVDQVNRSEEHTSELQSRLHLVCRLLLEKKKTNTTRYNN